MDFNYGRLPAEPTELARAARFANIRTASPVQVPASGDNLASIAPKLQMLGNDQYGNCVTVMIANLVFLVTGIYPTLDACLELYKTQNPRFPSQDGGMVIQKALATMQKTGIRLPDGTYKKIVFYALVDHTSAAEVEEALAIFGGVGYGIVVSNQNETEFDEGRDWTWATGDTDAGGHAVIGGGWSSSPRKRRFGTWAKETEWDATFDASRVDECWIVIFEEHVNGKVYLPGVSMSLVASEFERITGKQFPGAGPTPPGPQPTPPVPAPADADHQLATAATTYLKTKSHAATVIGKALAAWKAAKGL